MGIVLNREKENLFFKELGSMEGYNGRNINNYKEFSDTMLSLSRTVAEIGNEFKIEVDDNLLVLTDSHSRRAYLNRISQRIGIALNELEAALAGFSIGLDIATAGLIKGGFDFPIEEDWVKLHVLMAKVDLEDVNKFITARVDIENEPRTEEVSEAVFESNSKKIAWLYELGVIDKIVEGCKEGMSYNFSKAAKIINSFTDIHVETIRKALMGIYNSSESYQKNNPLKSLNTQLFLKEMKKRYKWFKE